MKIAVAQHGRPSRERFVLSTIRALEFSGALISWAQCMGLGFM